jgi:preprotein translocase subunit SecA
MHERRQKLMQGADSPSLLRDGDPDLFEKLTDEFGNDLIQKVERQITLCQIDRCWSEHLSQAAEVREGIHLVSIGGLNAFDEFNRQINAAFREYSMRVEQEVLATFRSVKITAAGVDLKKEGLLGPSSTWTYMINDNPTGDILQRLLRGMKRLVNGQS